MPLSLAILAIAWVIVHAVAFAVRHVLWLVVIVVIVIAASGCTTRPASPDLSRVDAAIAASRPRVPPEALTCRPEPRSPGGDAGGQAAARYVAGLVEAGRDCRGKLAVVKNALGED